MVQHVDSQIGKVPQDATLLICKKNVAIYVLLRCKIFSQKIWLCKFFLTNSMSAQRPDFNSALRVVNIAKGTTDPRVEFKSQDHSSQILSILQFQNLD